MFPLILTVLSRVFVAPTVIILMHRTVRKRRSIPKVFRVLGIWGSRLLGFGILGGSPANHPRSNPFLRLRPGKLAVVLGLTALCDESCNFLGFGGLLLVA